PALDEASRDQDLARLDAVAVALAHALGLARDVERVGRLELHPICELERFDPRVEPRILLSLLEVALVERAEKVELIPLRLPRQVVVADVLDQLLDLAMARVDIGPLVDPGEEGRLPVLRLLDRIAARAHGDEAREVSVLGAEAVSDPRAHARPD